jgi:hypothetical protein
MKNRVETFVVVEGEREIKTCASLLGAASEWAENASVRRVYRTAPTGPIGPNAWERVAEVSAIDLRAALDRAMTLTQ